MQAFNAQKVELKTVMPPSLILMDSIALDKFRKDICDPHDAAASANFAQKEPSKAI